MARKRMVSKEIVDTDAFLDMPLSAQALYLHMLVRADDDGFCDKPKQVMRVIGARDDDMKVLLAKRYILNFDSGIIVIKHWKIHNTIQKDRYKPSNYIEEKAMLQTKDNKAYTLGNTMDTKCIQNGYPEEKRLEEKRLEENRLEQQSSENLLVNSKVVVVDEEDNTLVIINLYQQEIGIPSPMVIELIEDWVNEHPLEYIKEAIKISVMNNIRKPKYIDAILRDWSKNGINRDKKSKNVEEPSCMQDVMTAEEWANEKEWG